MRAFSAVLTLLFLVSSGHSANIFVYDDDRGDELTDPNGHTIIGTEEAIVSALETLGHNVVVSYTVPTTLAGYDIVFSLHGWYDC
jgi:hypothetical protein